MGGFHAASLIQEDVVETKENLFFIEPNFRLSVKIFEANSPVLTLKLLDTTYEAIFKPNQDTFQRTPPQSDLVTSNHLSIKMIREEKILLKRSVINYCLFLKRNTCKR